MVGEFHLESVLAVVGPEGVHAEIGVHGDEPAALLDPARQATAHLCELCAVLGVHQQPSADDDVVILLRDDRTGIRHRVFDAQRLLRFLFTGEGDHAFGDVESDYLRGAGTTQQASEMPFAAGHVRPSRLSASSSAGRTRKPVEEQNGYRASVSLLTQLAGEPVHLELFGPDACLQSWLAAERALALAQSELGIIDLADAAAISAAARLDNIDRDELWASAKNVGYPILGMVRQISRLLPEGPNGRVHYGATTQDIMDTGLALQMQRSLYELDARLGQLGEALARQCEANAKTVMPARTHAQQAVPTTLGATLVSSRAVRAPPRA